MYATIPATIHVRGGSVQLEEDNISLLESQVIRIKSAARRKTESEWVTSKRGIKIDLNSSQRQDILTVKDQVVNLITPSRDPEALINPSIPGLVAFGTHANKRIIERLEPLTDEERDFILGNPPGSLSHFVSTETLIKIGQSLINSTVVDKKAEWKAYPYLTYTFRGKFDQKEISMSIVFEHGIFFVTLIDVISHGYYIGETSTGKNLKDNILKF